MIYFHADWRPVAANNNGEFFSKARLYLDETDYENPDLSRAELFISSQAGRFIPQVCAQFREAISGVCEWAWGELEAGPEVDGYWEAWDHALDFAIVHHPRLGDCRLYVHPDASDVWLVPVAMEGTP